MNMVFCPTCHGRYWQKARLKRCTFCHWQCQQRELLGDSGQLVSLYTADLAMELLLPKNVTEVHFCHVASFVVTCLPECMKIQQLLPCCSLCSTSSDVCLCFFSQKLNQLYRRSTLFVLKLCMCWIISTHGWSQSGYFNTFFFTACICCF